MVPMMWRGIPDELVAEDFTLPAQFTQRWRRPHTPERRLAFAVLWSAVVDLAKHRFAKRHRQKRLYWEAWEWVASTERSWEFSFERLCEQFEIEPGAARYWLLDVRRPPQKLISIERDADGESLPPGDLDHAA